MVKAHYILIFLAMTLGFLASCSKNEIDETSPELTLLMDSLSPVFYTGAAVPFLAEYTDDQDLKSFTLSVNGIYNPLINSSKYLESLWDTTFSKNITGQFSQVDIGLPVPANLKTGDYYLRTYCQDVLGNTSDTLRFDFRVVNLADTIPPVVDIVAPLPVDNIVTVLTANVVYIFEVSDDKLLGEAIINVLSMSGNLLYQAPVVDLAGLQTDFIAVTIPVPSTVGFYRSQIILGDAVNNLTIEEFLMDVK